MSSIKIKTLNSLREARATQALELVSSVAPLTTKGQRTH